VAKAPDQEWEAIDAAYEAGVCAYLEGEYATARDLLAQFIAQYPDDHRQAAAHFYMAAALDELGEYAVAIEEYRAYLARQEVLADLVYTRIGDDYVYLGQYEAAVETYQRALDEAVDPGQQYDLREQIGLIYSAWGRYEEATHWLQSVIERSQNVYRLARIWYLIGQTRRLAGQEEMAIDAFRQAVNGDPRPPHAHMALVALVEADVEVNEYQRGLINYHAANYGAAVGAFYRYMESTPDYDSDAHYYVALAYFNSASFELAIQECERMRDKYPPTQPHWGDMWLIKAQALDRLKRIDEAVTVYLDFAAAHADHPLAPEARWEAAWLLEGEGRFDQAADIYTALADQHTNDEKAPAARFRAGICRYRDDDPDAALAAWRELVEGYPSTAEAVQGRYWLGKVLWTHGQVAEARSTLQALADAYPRDYYGLRAAHLLASEGRPVPWVDTPADFSVLASPHASLASLHLTGDEEAEKTEGAGWLRTWAGAPDNQDPARVSTNLADDIRLRRGMEMIALGLREQARDEFESLRKDLDQDPLLLYQLALLTRDLGVYATSLRATLNLIALAPQPSVLQMPRLIQRLAFPVYFDDLVMVECASYGIDPLVMFALIRQESVFDDGVASWAGAVGLAQLMPSTGEWVAEMMPWPGYSEAHLTRAYLNVKFGTWFLARILQGTDGDVMAALAGYNGGPAYGAHWLELAKGDPDLFVEVITRDEPQRYVREVYRHYDMYVRLYGNKP